MKKKTEPFQFKFGEGEQEFQINQTTQSQVLTIVCLLSHIGIKTIEDIDWDELVEKAPIFKDIGGEGFEGRERFFRAGLAAVEIFNRWQKQESNSLEDEEMEVWVEDLEDSLVLIDEFQDKLTRKQRGWD